ncbi:MAG TPA: anti-sigma factor, partial [Planctomycetota bacterium]
MTTHESIDHGWVREHIATYLAGGLPEEERARFEAHIGGCGPCLEDLQDAQSTERSLSKLLDADRPKPGLEDRVIQSLRAAPGPRFRVPRTAYRVVSTIAAVLLIGVVGFVFDSGSLAKESKGHVIHANPLFGLSVRSGVEGRPAPGSEVGPGSVTR